MQTAGPGRGRANRPCCHLPAWPRGAAGAPSRFPARTRLRWAEAGVSRQMPAGGPGEPCPEAAARGRSSASCRIDLGSAESSPGRSCARRGGFWFLFSTSAARRRAPRSATALPNSRGLRGRLGAPRRRDGAYRPPFLLPAAGATAPREAEPAELRAVLPAGFPLLPPATELRVAELRPRTARPGAVGPGRGEWPRREPVASGCPLAPWQPGGEGGGRGQAGAPSSPAGAARGGRLHRRGSSVLLPRSCRPLPLLSPSCGAAASEKAERSGAAGPQPGRQRCAASPGPAGGSAAPGGRRVPSAVRRCQQVWESRGASFWFWFRDLKGF